MACLCLAACTAVEVRTGAAFGDVGRSLVAASAPSWELTPVPRETEATLRSRLANDVDPSAAALELVWRLQREERHGEALYVVETALRRRPQVMPLEATRAGLLRDLGRRHEAVAALVVLRAAVGVGNMHPGMLFELAELQWLEGDGQAGQQTLAGLVEHHAEHGWTSSRTVDLAELERALRAPAPDRMSMRDLLGNLRGCPDSLERLGAFEALVALGGEGRVRAEAVMLDDRDPLLRARGVSQANVRPAVLAGFCAAALTDSESLVRAAGAARTSGLPPAEAAALLLPVMAAETSAEAFCVMHAVLRQVSGIGNDLSTNAATDPARRAAVLAEWRRQWEM